MATTELRRIEVGDIAFIIGTGKAQVVLPNGAVKDYTLDAIEQEIASTEAILDALDDCYVELLDPTHGNGEGNDDPEPEEGKFNFDPRTVEALSKILGTKVFSTIDGDEPEECTCDAREVLAHDIIDGLMDYRERVAEALRDYDEAVDAAIHDAIDLAPDYLAGEA